MEWKTVKLGDIGTIVGGATPLTKNPSYYDGDIAWITPKDLASYSQRYIYNGERNITKEGLRSCSCKMMPKGSVLFSSRAPIGYTAIAGQELCTNQGFKSIIPNPEKADSEFIYYLLKHHKDYIAGLGSGTTFMEVSGSVMKNIELALPPLAEQQRIAAILSSLDAKIENNARINANLEAQAQALYKSWFVDFEPWGGVMPEDWKEGSLGDLCITNKRTSNGKYNTCINYIDTGSVTKNRLNDVQVLNPTIDKIPSRARRLVSEGDIIYSSVRPNQCHYMFMYDPSPDIVVSTGFVVITSNWSAYRYYIYQYIIQESTVSTLQAIAEQSVSTYPSINASDITNLNIVIPSNDIIEKFANFMNKVMQRIEESNKESQRLAQLRDTLLPKLMRGEIEL